jgi:hypothetical protein
MPICMTSSNFAEASTGLSRQSADGDVAGFGAAAVGGGDFTDCAGRVFGVQQGLDLAPDAVAVLKGSETPPYETTGASPCAYA